MTLQRYIPLRVFLHIFYDHREHFISHAPFGLEVQEALIMDPFRIKFGPCQVPLITDYHLELTGKCIIVVNREAALFGREADPVPFTGERL